MHPHTKNRFTSSLFSPFITAQKGPGVALTCQYLMTVQSCFKHNNVFLNTVRFYGSNSKLNSCVWFCYKMWNLPKFQFNLIIFFPTNYNAFDMGED